MRIGLVLPLFLLGVPSIVLSQSAGTFTETGHLTTLRAVHTATLLNDGTVLIAGGSSVGVLIGPTARVEFLSSADLYNPRTGTFTPTGTMTTPRYGHTATLLPSGKVLIVGGTPDGSSGLQLPSAELYDPVTKTFTATGTMAVGREFHKAALLLDGRVLIAGSRTAFDRNANAELYDPSTGTFTAIGVMAEAFVSTATLLASGKVFITHGGGRLVDAELYDPSTGMFSPTGNPSGYYDIGHGHFANERQRPAYRHRKF